MSPCLAFLLLGPTQSPEILVDRVIAVIDQEVVTETELLTEARVALVFREGERGVKLASGDMDAELLASMREYVINQLLVANQVRRIGTIDVSEQDLERAVRRYSQSFASPDAQRAFARKFEITEATVRDILRRDLRNDKFLTQRLRVSGDAGDERYTTALARWLAELRGNSEIRLLGPTGALELQ